MAKPREIYGHPWTEPEYIIVLHYYFRHRGKAHDKHNDYVKEIAQLLGRTPASVVMRLQNYGSLDGHPGRSGKGLVNIGPKGRQVFEQWVHKVDALKSCAEVFIREAERACAPTLFDPEPVRVPKAFSAYELLDAIGEGTFGLVFSCLNINTDQRYAIKILKTEGVGGDEILSRFRREMHALRSIRHPNVIKIHADNLDEADGYPAFIMDLAEADLCDHIQSSIPRKRGAKNKPLLPHVEAVSIMRAVINGLSALHTHAPQIVHRDINPKNILRLTDGTWVLADFSLAKFLPEAEHASAFRTNSAQVWGSAPYTAPEQWQDFGHVDVRADIYSLGVLVWELFSPEWPPFDRASEAMPRSIGLLLSRATERDREKRFSTVDDFASAFEKAVADSFPAITHA